MPAPRRFRSWRAWRHRLSVVGVCLAYTVAALDIPLPLAVARGGGEPFPCQGHLCGCGTAEQCWRRCCCFTPQQRWEWARRRGVEPPAYAEKPAAEGWNAPKRRDGDRGQVAAAEPSCCRAHGACCQKTPKSPAKPADPKGKPVRCGTVLSAQHCQGYTTLWVSLGAVSPPTPPAAWAPEWSPPARLPLTDSTARGTSTPPLTPPPRLPVV